MQQIRIDSKDGIAAGFAGVGDARNLPDRAKRNASVSKSDAHNDEPSPKRGLMAAALRFARNAAAGLALLAAVPFGAVLWTSTHLTARPWADTKLKLEQIEGWRVLKAPVDPSITPIEAGLAFAHLQAPQQGAPKSSVVSVEGNRQFPSRESVEQPMWPWRANRPGPEIFAVRDGAFDGPSTEEVLRNAERGFSPAEMAWLKNLAEAPVWKDVDKVASAQSVDLIGGQYKLPFRDDAFAPMMPFVRFAGTKELAYAGVSRAAYYLAIGQPDRAEAALRSVVSFGFVLVDNGTSAIDGLIGRVIVGIGKRGLEQFATNGRTMPTVVDAAPTQKVRNTNFGDPNLPHVGGAEYRNQLLKDVNNPALPRTLRYEQLSQLSFNTCQNIPEMVTGPNQETRDAFANAGASMVRFPSEKAQLDLLLDATNRIPEDEIPISLPKRLVIGAATVASTITHNPRFASCTKLAVVYW